MPLHFTKVDRMMGFAVDIRDGVEIEEALKKNDLSRSALGLCKELHCTHPRQQASSRCETHKAV